MMALANYISPEAIQLQVKAADWEDAVRSAGKILYDQGLCELRYIDAMVQAVHDMGPYMVLAPGMALAHARPEDGMLKPGISIINLTDPVKFGHASNDPVSLIISFGGIDNESHGGMLRTLAIFLMDESKQERLKTACSRQEVLEIIYQE
jgi:mannitol/fructose-specific phosphotransferase system IIA component (Ntr-type)